MDYKINKLPKNLLEIEVSLSVEEMKSFYQQALKDAAQEITISGFRPGKAPFDLAEKELGKIKILEMAAEHAVSERYREILLKEKFNPVDQPKIDLVKLAPDNPFIFKLTVPLLPQTKIGDLKKIKVKTSSVKIEDKQVEAALKELQQMRRKETLVNRPVAKGDRAEVDLEMFLEKVPLENGQAKNMSVVLGEDFYIPGLSDNLIGLKPGESKEFKLKYPESHFDKKLANREIDFRVQINNLYNIELPKIDDEFAKNLGQFKNLEELRTQLKKNLEEEARHKEEERQEIDLLQQLVQKSEFGEVPDILVDDELDKMIAELRGAIEQQNLKFEDYLSQLKKTVDDLRKEFRVKAEERVKIALAIHELAHQEKIIVESSEISQEIEKMKGAYKNEPEILEKIQSESGQSYLKNIILNKKVIHWLKQKVL